MKKLIISLTKSIPTVRANLFGAIKRNLPDWKKKEKGERDVP